MRRLPCRTWTRRPSCDCPSEPYRHTPGLSSASTGSIADGTACRLLLLQRRDGAVGTGRSAAHAACPCASGLPGIAISGRSPHRMVLPAGLRNNGCSPDTAAHCRGGDSRDEPDRAHGNKSALCRLEQGMSFPVITTA